MLRVWLSVIIALAALGFLVLQDQMRIPSTSPYLLSPIEWTTGCSPHPILSDLLALESNQEFAIHRNAENPTPPDAPMACARILLRNPDRQPLTLALLPKNPRVDHFVLFDPEGDTGIPRKELTGQAHPQILRSTLSLAPSVRVTLPAGKNKRVFVYVQDDIHPAPEILIQEATLFDRTQNLEFTFYIAYFAATGALFCFHLLFYTVMQDRRQLWFLIYLASTMILVFISSGVHSLFYPIWGIWGDTLVLIALLTNSLVFLEFLRIFLFASTRSSRCYLGLRICQKSVLCVTGLTLILPTGITGIQSAIFLLVLLGFLAVHLMAIACAIRSAQHHVPGARILLIAFLPLTAGIAMGIADDLGLYHDHTFGFPPLAGSAISVIFMGIALAHQYRRLQQENLLLRNHYTENLETSVARRTRELKSAKQNLESVLRDRDRVLSIIGHDLRSLIGQRENASALLMMQGDALDNADKRLLLETIRESSRNELDLLDNLLQWGKARSLAEPGAPLRTFASPLSEPVSRAIADITELATEKHIRVNQKLHPDILVGIDPGALTIVVRNLLTNAIKFTPQGGEIQVQTYLEGDNANVEVSDSGTGMDEQTLSRLATTCTQLPQRGTSGEQGNGLGLLLCRELLDTFKAELSFASHLGKGTTATIKLPVSANPQPANPHRDKP